MPLPGTHRRPGEGHFPCRNGADWASERRPADSAWAGVNLSENGGAKLCTPHKKAAELKRSFGKGPARRPKYRETRVKQKMKPCVQNLQFYGNDRKTKGTFARFVYC